MQDPHLSDKDREKYYRDYISRLKLPSQTVKSDLVTLLKSTPLVELNNATRMESLPTALLTDIRYVAVPPKTRDELVETYIGTLPPPPESTNRTESRRKDEEKEKAARALREREERVRAEKRRQEARLRAEREHLRRGEEQLERVMRDKGSKIGEVLARQEAKKEAQVD